MKKPKRGVGSSPLPCFGSLPARAARSLDLPQVVVDGECVHAGGHALGGDDGELLAVGAVLVELVDHLAVDAARSRPCEFGDLLRLGGVGVNGAELAPAVAEEDDQMVAFTLFQLLGNVKKKGMKRANSFCAVVTSDVRILKCL